jgi:Bacterial regulatory proteins, luxR family
MRYVVDGFLNKQTADELKITENTVQVHRGRVMRKMRADSLAALVSMALRLAACGEHSLLRVASPPTPEHESRSLNDGIVTSLASAM